MEIIKPSFRKILESYRNHILTNSIYKEYKNSKMTQFLKNLVGVNNFQKIYHNNNDFCSLAEVINLLDKDNDDGDIGNATLNLILVSRNLLEIGFCEALGPPSGDTLDKYRDDYNKLVRFGVDRCLETSSFTYTMERLSYIKLFLVCNITS
ncbi:8120_t:CDS:2 [Entrophospora sp. SA101]|nr:8120_t:CDS:2 [Entrophospora sp. SA101]